MKRACLQNVHVHEKMDMQIPYNLNEKIIII